MNTEPIIQKEVSQKEKNTVYGIQKDGTDEPICRIAKEMHTETTDLRNQWGTERMG